MNYIDQKNETVKDVQRWLREYGRIVPDFPQVFIDGVYGERTAAAVREFQKRNGLFVSAEVDKATFDLLYAEYRSIMNASRVFGYSPAFSELENGEMRYGDRFDDVYLLQLLLRAGAVDDTELFIEVTGEFDDATERAVRKLQSKIGMQENGRVDAELWNMLIILAGKYKYNL